MHGWFEFSREVFSRGGPFMWPLLALSILAVALILDRCIFWFALAGRTGPTWVARVCERLRAADEPAVHAIIASERSIHARIVRDMLAMPPHEGLAVELAERSRRTIERHAAALSTIITAAPLLGILGTVTGIIKSFDLLGQTRDIADIEMVASGIAEALITTAAGLIITLVALFPYMYFRARADRLMGDIDRLAAARLAAHQSGARPASRS